MIIDKIIKWLYKEYYGLPRLIWICLAGMLITFCLLWLSFANIIDLG